MDELKIILRLSYNFKKVYNFHQPVYLYLQNIEPSMKCFVTTKTINYVFKGFIIYFILNVHIIIFLLWII